jgi:uncharacterized LabA/DUF88 family protein
LDVDVAVEFVAVVEVETVDAAAMTQGDANMAAAMAIAATTDNCAVLVFILPSRWSGTSLVFTGFPR